MYIAKYDAPKFQLYQINILLWYTYTYEILRIEIKFNIYYTRIPITYGYKGRLDSNALYLV